MHLLRKLFPKSKGFGESWVRDKAVFLDRDGIINKDIGYIDSIEKIIFLKEVPQEIKRLRAEGYKIVIVTNQSGVARGFFTEEKLGEINQEIVRKLKDEGAVIDKVYYCPHLPDALIEKYRLDCNCRKPKPGLIIKAAEELNLDLSKSFIIGDSERDIEAGKRAGCKAVLIQGRGSKVKGSKKGLKTEEEKLKSLKIRVKGLEKRVKGGKLKANKVVNSLKEAVDWILKENR